VTERMLSHHPVHGTYQLGPRLIKLAHASWSHGSLQDVSRPVLDALHSQLQRTIHLAQLDDGQVLYLDKRVANHGPAMFSKPGKIGPGYCTGVGKAMLAFLPTSALEEAIQQQTFRAHTPQTIVNPDALREELDTIRLRGFAFDREEHEPGIICIAVPILSDDGQLFGAISATGPGSAAEVEELADLAPALQQAARNIANDATIRMAPTLS
ncbi:MAG: IclR family transcriptional regulator, partial [Pseudomonadota bacterium]